MRRLYIYFLSKYKKSECIMEKNKKILYFSKATMCCIIIYRDFLKLQTDFYGYTL